MLSRRPADSRRDSGFSLVELLVVIGLLAVVGVVAVQALASSYRATTVVQTETTSSAEMQRAIERIAREIRVADPIEVVTPSGNQLQLRVVRDGVCLRYFYREVGQRLVQYVQSPLTPAPPPIGAPSATGRCTTPAPASLSALPATVVIDDLPPSTSVFRYFSEAGTEITFPGGDIDMIAQVEITLRRNTNGRVLVTTTRVDVRNQVEAPL